MGDAGRHPVGGAPISRRACHWIALTAAILAGVASVLITSLGR
jgi:hypothetical protein